VFWGVLTPLRNNQTDVTNPAYTGAIQAYDIRHVLLATDTAYMSAPNRDPFTDRGQLWAVWQGDSGDAGSSLGPSQAPQIPFAWHNGGPSYPIRLDAVDSLADIVAGPQGAGAGKIGLATAQWLRIAN
jgi:pectate lyase